MIILVTVFVLLLIVGTSFALWQIVLKQNDSNTITTSCFKVEYTNETDAINLNDAIPLTDDEGKKLVPYSFTLTNTCNTKADYVINLETFNQGENILKDEYIKANLIKGTEEVFLSKLTTNYENLEKVIKDSTAAYMLDQGTLEGKESTTYSLRLWIDSDANNIEEMMDRVFASKITVTTTYVPKETGVSLYDIVKEQASLDNTSSEFVTASTGINFGETSSDTNGKGVYTIASTKDSTYPVHYFRGAVTNNNVKFANFCWKIVRTTETGGVKLIYNGTTDGNGKCTNATGEKTQIGTSPFALNASSIADVGYMYGKRYSSNRKSVSTSETYTWIYGNDVEYADGKYILKNTAEYSTSSFSTDKNTGFNAHRYTCFSTANSCTSVNYLYYNDYYITLTGGKKIDDAFNEMITNSSNTNNSAVKTTIDTWYKNNMTDYTNYLEDTVWCNDRSIYQKGSWNKNSTVNGITGFGGFQRNTISYKPSIVCPNANDRFTVNNENGNGKLTYPVALLTVDETALAGHRYNNTNTNTNTSSYLYTNQLWWLLSPNSTDDYLVLNFWMYSNGALGNRSVIATDVGVRPSISLAKGTMVSEESDGSPTNPYVVILN